MHKTQLWSSGAPSMDELFQMHDPQHTEEKVANVTAIMVASDGGPDQVGQAKHWMQKTTYLPTLLIIYVRCYFLVYSRQSEGHLKRIEDSLQSWPGLVHLSWKSYPSLCKLCHVSRELSSDICDMWGVPHGISEQLLRCISLLPRPGRTLATRLQD